MSVYLAHSAGEGYPAQEYHDHVENVSQSAFDFADELRCHYTGNYYLLKEFITSGANYHDLGKLVAENQDVLRGLRHEPHLPVNHVDAGTAFLLKKQAVTPALLVYSHHRGLPDLMDECCRGDFFLRDERLEIRALTDSKLDDLKNLHQSLCPAHLSVSSEEPEVQSPFLFRMALSCLADADHSDTAKAKGQYPEKDDFPSLNAEARLEALNQYVSSLKGIGERNQLRKEMYHACKAASPNGHIITCDSPVGSGKTTAVMAQMLNCAAKNHLRRIFVVLPYTNIIRQAVKVYRKALTLPGENPEKVVSELHSRADFQSDDTRYLTALWKAPIIVTTAVSFFETMASNKPAALRRLHELPGSAIFMDEAHAALPLHLLPLTWQWMNELADDWNCYWIMASGSLVHFWEIPELTSLKRSVPELVPFSIREKLMKYEQNRIHFRWLDTPVSLAGLISFVMNKPGPRLLILNTVQNAAFVAKTIMKQYGSDAVVHLSTALSPSDREETIDLIQSRLSDPQDNDWVLVATSCVEAGVDFSFKTGFREAASLLSLLQASGRINRNGADSDAEIWSFVFQDDPLLNSNPGVKNAANILIRYFSSNTPIVPELSTQSIIDELCQYNTCKEKINKLSEAEEAMNFKTVADQYHVIDSDTVLAVVDDQLAQQIRLGMGNWQELQKKSIAVSKWNIKKWHLEPINQEIYRWTLPYDEQLGYMAGVLNLEELTIGFLSC